MYWNKILLKAFSFPSSLLNSSHKSQPLSVVALFLAKNYYNMIHETYDKAQCYSWNSNKNT